MDEDFDQLEMECNNCHLKFYAGDLQVHPEKNELICSNCISFGGGKVTVLKDKPLPKRKIPPPEASLPSAAPVSRSYPGLPPGYAPFKCDACRYVFSRKTDFNGVCPYCSKKSVRMLKPSEVKG